MRWNDPQCRGFAEFFFPVAGETTEEKRSRQGFARWLCEGCPDRGPCTELGLREEVERPEDDRYAPGGVWGGMRRRELLRLARKRGQA